MKPNYCRNKMYIRAAQVRVGDVFMLSIDEYGPAVTAVDRKDGLIVLQLDTGEVLGGDPNDRVYVAR
jgi:hypothetical protein